MAYLVTNNVFDPLSFDELVKPLAMYKQVYDQAMNQYDTLGINTGEWTGKLGKEDADSNAYKAAQEYANNLNAAADELSRNGLNINTRNAVRNLNKDFTNTIKPISEAWERRNVQRSLQQKYMLDNPGSFIERDLFDANNGNIDNFVGDAGYNFGNAYSAKELRAEAARKMAALANELRGTTQNGEKTFASTAAGATITPQLQKVLPYQYKWLEEHGVSSDDITKWQNGTLTGPIKDVLDSVADSVFESSGIGRWASESEQQRARDMIKSEGYNAVGQSRWHETTDNYSMQVALEAMRHNNAMAETNEKNKPAKGSDDDGEKTVTPVEPKYQTQFQQYDAVPNSKEGFRRSLGLDWKSRNSGNFLLNVAATINPLFWGAAKQSNEDNVKMRKEWHDARYDENGNKKGGALVDEDTPVFNFDVTPALNGNVSNLLSKGTTEWVTSFNEDTGGFIPGKKRVKINDLYSAKTGQPKFNNFQIKVQANANDPILFDFGNEQVANPKTKEFTNQTQKAIKAVQKAYKEKMLVNKAQEINRIKSMDIDPREQTKMINELFPNKSDLTAAMAYTSLDPDVYAGYKDQYVKAMNELLEQLEFELHGDRGDLSEKNTAAYSPHEN